MLVSENQIIGTIVADNYRTASVFKSFKIDFCCQGNRTLSEACAKQNVAPENVIKALEDVMGDLQTNDIDFSTWPLDLLVDYIEKKHHRYVEKKSEEIKPFLDKIAAVHGKNHPELITVRTMFYESVSELAAHMKKEELILFPFIKKMVAAKESNKGIAVPHFETVENPIHMMNQDHEVEGERFRQISELTNDYEPPADACSTYQVTFAMLKEFEADLHLHIHIENNILFLKAIALEKTLNILEVQ